MGHLQVGHKGGLILGDCLMNTLFHRLIKIAHLSFLSHLINLLRIAKQKNLSNHQSLTRNICRQKAIYVIFSLNEFHKDFVKLISRKKHMDCILAALIRSQKMKTTIMLFGIFFWNILIQIIWWIFSNIIKY